jgi:hypothetical protein
MPMEPFTGFPEPAVGAIGDLRNVGSFFRAGVEPVGKILIRAQVDKGPLRGKRGALSWWSERPGVNG